MTVTLARLPSRSGIAAPGLKKKSEITTGSSDTVAWSIPAQGTSWTARPGQRKPAGVMTRKGVFRRR